MDETLDRDQLRIGMTVRLNQLSEIYSEYMLISHVHAALDVNGLPSETEGTLEFIGDIYGRSAWIKEHPEIKVMVVSHRPYEGSL